MARVNAWSYTKKLLRFTYLVVPVISLVCGFLINVKDAVIFFLAASFIFILLGFYFYYICKNATYDTEKDSIVNWDWKKEQENQLNEE